MKPSDKKSPIDTKPDSEFIAQQLRRPSGEFAPKVGSMMNQVNKPLYDLVFDVIEVQKMITYWRLALVMASFLMSYSRKSLNCT